MRRERPNHTLTPNALVHEAYLRLAPGAGPSTHLSTFLSPDRASHVALVNSIGLADGRAGRGWREPQPAPDRSYEAALGTIRGHVAEWDDACLEYVRIHYGWGLSSERPRLAMIQARNADVMQNTPILSDRRVERDRQTPARAAAPRARRARRTGPSSAGAPLLRSCRSPGNLPYVDLDPVPRVFFTFRDGPFQCVSPERAPRLRSRSAKPGISGGNPR